MTLKSVIDSLDGIPEAVRDSYVERDGKYHLAVEGMVPKDRLDEFRTNNIALKRERDDLMARFDGVDLDRYRELVDKAEKERSRKLIDAGKVDELVAERVNAMKADHDKEVKRLADENARITSQLEGLVIDGAIRDAAMKAGARPEAIEDFLYRGRQIYRLQDGRAVPMEGDRPIYGKSGAPMEIGEWVSTLTEKAPHLFTPSVGSGARAGATNGAGVPAGMISRDDTSAFLANLEKIASGQIKVA